ncbi:NAD(P)H-dependent oxidoreductase [Actinokineospora auranticolor]|uniref:NAD(P)H-dependent FMN reductase n=1 Tax=Actinokineospora auranticolor TaxID=155976 RepID=A0A2S6GHL8_9PSEU|nr:NAD(P)H-dependent oxidoreductase [Actinokineospora auranticolor]PPK64709.1 NAD(P)H-dependent FMN reductase [Actinokineospora auranticolor]
MTRIAVITGSTRPGRRALAVAEWVVTAARAHYPAEVGVGLVDLADFALPLLDEPAPAITGDYRNPHTLAWSKTIAAYDGFVFVTPEYNHSYPASLKNALDYLYAEWHDKAAGFVSYGPQAAGVRAVEHLRLSLAELKVAGVRTQVALSMHTDFTITNPLEQGDFTPAPRQLTTLHVLLDEVHDWSRALATLRASAVAA